jgi:uncharacterized protein (DUF488 family)
VEIATIGFTQSPADHFFERLRRGGVRRLVDVRLNHTSQLAGFSKSEDLAYFLAKIVNARYEHDQRLAPTEELLAAYRKKQISWPDYEQSFLELMRERGIPAAVDRRAFAEKTVLLCSEASADRCHRRLVAELLGGYWGASVEHL